MLAYQVFAAKIRHFLLEEHLGPTIEAHQTEPSHKEVCISSACEVKGGYLRGVQQGVPGEVLHHLRLL